MDKAYTDTLITRGIYDRKAQEYNGHPNRACWAMTLWIENDYDEYKEACDIGAKQGLASLATHLEEFYSYHGYPRALTVKQLRLLNRPIFSDGAAKSLLDRGASTYAVADALQRMAEYGNDDMLPCCHWSDLLTWGLAVLDYEAYVKRDVQQTPPTYLMVLNTVLSIIDWSYVASHYLPEAD